MTRVETCTYILLCAGNLFQINALEPHETRFGGSSTLIGDQVCRSQWLITGCHYPCRSSFTHFKWMTLAPCLMSIILGMVKSKTRFQRTNPLHPWWLSPLCSLLIISSILQLRLQGTWVWHFMTSCPTTCSWRFILHSIRRICTFLNQETKLALAISDYCQHLWLRIHQPSSSSAYLSSPILQGSTAMCTGCCWLLKSDSTLVLSRT